MKSAGIVILLPLLSVLIVSLYFQGGTPRVAAIVLLAVSFAGTIGVFLRRGSTHSNR